MPLLSNKSMIGRLRNLSRALFLMVLLGLAGSSAILFGQQASGRLVVFPTQIQWNRQRNVNRYRLQIATDEKFQDVFFDGRVSGNRYTVSDLLPGAYYWRVAPADSQRGEFSRPVRFFISGGMITSVRRSNRSAGVR